MIRHSQEHGIHPTSEEEPAESKTDVIHQGETLIISEAPSAASTEEERKE